MNTPWGNSQHTDVLERGAVWASTASHGGLMLTHTYVEKHKLSQFCTDEGEATQTHYCFEEDCAWEVAAWELPRLWPFLFRHGNMKGDKEAQKEHLIKTLRFWYPRFAAFHNLFDIVELPLKINCGGRLADGGHCYHDSYIVAHINDEGVACLKCRGCDKIFWTAKEGTAKSKPEPQESTIRLYTEGNLLRVEGLDRDFLVGEEIDRFKLCLQVFSPIVVDGDTLADLAERVKTTYSEEKSSLIDEMADFLRGLDERARDGGEL